MDKTIEHDGIAYTVPSEVKQLPVEAIEAWEDDKVISFVRSLVGSETWAKFKATNPTLEDFENLAVKIGGVYGFETAGESSGSGASSTGTAEPSPPTSSTSTDSTSLQSVNAP
jgi:hypothetical protein